ncbi:hypothetical protein ALO42_101925 [Pseudomonas syringae pv. atrofaciens]|uniref:Uncharacterized protein n=4 Tax=Pseudomonas syringae group TaxID=136849 RepID=F3GEM6_PSESJ|nr:hypothetical protein PSYPI_25734 [Pseudomonas syringae pv. pisi str. 1704B]KPW10307.1 hypothetical protein ALO42_101925 [Pseudomonas syringae pv. atrofaciens]RML61425.1 hypothetical protein ALQ93_101703 [Pseudomonas syringae pv. pisi]RMU63908.1 hypothetical protein ALP25_101494 [Pseudomonas syringae pv. syringae]RMU77224.1 hypothetical protein ALP24_03655 [Pseudomonas syringae pv. aptata]RMU89984.1 hypothetical protein ALP21_101482 [Pseudomonas savastanoi pv. phaseolicola]
MAFRVSEQMMYDLEPGVDRRVRCKKGRGGEKPDNGLHSPYQSTETGS